MSFIVDKRRKDNHTREECGSVRNLLSVFFKSLFKKVLALQQKFPMYDLKHFERLEWNKNKKVQFSLDPLPCSYYLFIYLHFFNVGKL